MKKIDLFSMHIGQIILNLSFLYASVYTKDNKKKYMY